MRTVVGTYSPIIVVDWLVPGRNLFLAIQVLGIACFVFIVSRRIVPLLRCFEPKQIRALIAPSLASEGSSNFGSDNGSIPGTALRVRSTLLSSSVSFF